MFVKHSLSIGVLATAVCLGISVASAQITIPTVPIGDPGNDWDFINGRGSVWYTYNIGKFEVTAGQYAAFLNAVARSDPNNLYNPDQARTDYGSGIARSGTSGSYSYSVDPAFVNRPVNYVSFWDACRFANWLHNGQPSGEQNASTTEGGAYTLTPAGISANTITRNEGWRWAVTSENEWYKAAYYKGGSTNAGYWFYPTSSNAVPGNNLADPSGNNANWWTGAGTFPIQGTYFTTVAGQFANSPSPHGTFDMAGNLSEWNEAINGLDRRRRGGSFFDTDFNALASYGPIVHNRPQAEYFSWGFRVAQAIVLPQCPACAADYDDNGGIDGSDIAAFFTDFEAGASCADTNEDGGIDGSDIEFFFAVFEAGAC